MEPLIVIIALLFFAAFCFKKAKALLKQNPEQAREELKQAREDFKQVRKDLKQTLRPTVTTSTEPSTPTEHQNVSEWQKDLTIIWQGKPKLVEFTYQSNRSARQRRKVAVDKVSKTSKQQVYLSGVCQDRKEERSFNTDNIRTMILHNNQRHEVYDWLFDVLKIDIATELSND
jgi:predicted DNA-binding transcriptional regulator YafY